MNRATPMSKTERKPYQTPRLRDYGDLRRIVMAQKHGTRSDGRGVPSTKR